MKNFNGNVLFLDRSDINTDEIIPARYLTEIDKAALKPHLLEDLCLDGFMQRFDIQDKNAIITRANYGCGSSREHAPWALEVNGINLIIAESYARIFRQNMFNCGMLAAELPAATIDMIFATFAGSKTTIATDLANKQFTLRSDDREETVPFSISEFDMALIEAGGWLNYADSRY